MNDNYSLPVINFSHARKQASPEGENYDISLGISEATFNKILKSVHVGVYPAFFQDSIYLDKVKISIAWDMKNAPEVTLRQSPHAYESFLRVYGSPEKINESLMGALVGLSRPGVPEDESLNTSEENKVERPFIDLDASQQIFVEINIKQVNLTMENKAKGTGPKKATASARLDCIVQLNDKNEICVEPFSVFLDIKYETLMEAFGTDLFETDANNIVTLPGEVKSYKFSYKEFFDFLMNHILFPALIKKITPLIPRFKIPDFQFMGLKIADLDVRLDKYYLVASANIKKVVKSEAPETVNPPGLMDPEGGIFVALSQKFLQAAIGATVKQYGKIQNQGSVSIIDYTYALEISNPEIGIEKDLIKLAFSAKGDASVSVDLWLFSLVFAAHVSTLGKPGAVGELSINKNNNDVLFKIKSLNPLWFNVDVVSPLPAFIASRVISLLITRLVAGVEVFLTGKELKIFTIPTVTFPFEGFDIGVTLEHPDLKLYDANLKFKSDLKVFISSVNDYLTEGVSLIPGQILRSENKKYSLTYQEDGNLVLRKGLYDILWNSGTTVNRAEGMRPGRCLFGYYANFIIYNKDKDDKDVIAFQTYTADVNVPHFFKVMNDGSIQVLNKYNNVLWRVQGARENNCLRRSKGQFLLPSETLFSDNGHYALTYQYDGNLVLRKTTGEGNVLWESEDKMDRTKYRALKASFNDKDNNGDFLLMESPLVKGATGWWYWHSGTYNSNTREEVLFVSDEGYVAISAHEDRKEILWRRPAQRTLINVL